MTLNDATFIDPEEQRVGASLDYAYILYKQILTLQRVFTVGDYEATERGIKILETVLTPYIDTKYKEAKTKAQKELEEKNEEETKYWVTMLGELMKLLGRNNLLPRQRKTDEV